MRTTLHFLRTNKRFLAFGISLTFLSSYGQSFFFGLYNHEIRDAYNITNTEFGSIYGIITVISALLISYAGRILDRAHLPYYALSVLAIVSAGCFMIGLTSHFAIFITGLFLVRFAGQGLLGHTNNTSMARYFDETRGRAITITRMGAELGAVIFPLIVINLIDVIGWKQSWVVFGALILFPVFPLILWLLHDHRDRHDSWLLSEQQKNDSQNAITGEPPLKEWTQGKVLTDIRFYLTMPVLLSGPLIGTGILFYIKNVSLAKGWEDTFLAQFMGLQALTVTVFCLISGVLVDRFGSTRLLPMISIFMCIALGILTYSNHPAVAPLFMFFNGISNGFLVAASIAIWAEMYGTKHLGSIKALVMMLMVFSTALMPPVMGNLFDQAVPLETITLGLLCYTAIAGLATLPLLIQSKFRLQT